MNELQVVEYNNQRVLLTEQMAQAYGCDTINIQQNFVNNKARFEEGKHYFKLEGEELRSFKASLGDSKFSSNLRFAPSLMLWTERGAARHSKMLGTDMAWEVFDQLEETYFNVRPLKQLSPIELIAAQANALVEQEKKLKELQAQQERQSQELQGMRDVITLSSTEWRKETTRLLNKIAQARGDNYMDVRRESYNLLNERMGVSVDVRLKNARARMYECGYSKTQIDKLNALDVIGQDKKLIEGYMAIVKDMSIRYGVA
jgi:hypothetical protein